MTEGFALQCPVPLPPGASVLRTREDGWVEVAIPSGPDQALAGWVLSFGPDAVVLEPPALRAEVLRRLEAILAAG